MKNQKSEVLSKEPFRNGREEKEDKDRLKIKIGKRKSSANSFLSLSPELLPPRWSTKFHRNVE